MNHHPPPTHVQTLGHVLLAARVPAVFVLVVWALGAAVLAAWHPPVDAVFWAAMMLTGMGPPPLLADTTWEEKVFLSVYALLSGFVFLGAVGFALQPLLRRVLHLFHLGSG